MRFTSQGVRSVLIESPTGSGKTVMGLLVARALQEALGLRVGWVAMRRYLLDQARSESERLGINVDASWVSMFDRTPPTGLDLLVVDEAQHDAAQSMAVLHQTVRPRFILGLSATPFRADKVKLCFDTVIKDAGIHSLIQDGYLSSFHHYMLPTWSPEVAVKTYLDDRARWGKSIFYFHTLAECARADAMLKSAGVRSEVVHGGSDREAQLAAFQAGEVDVLSNCMVLAEGFDCPKLQTVFCRPSGKSVTVQMAGRVLRKPPEPVQKQIVQSQGTKWPFAKTALPAQQFVWADGGWRTLRANAIIQQVSLKVMHALARTNVELPKWVVQRAGYLNRRAKYARSEAE
ncbi:MAG: helicase [Gemmataceae bacterium]|nr:helicase [Gemmataceae bacterium]